MPNYYCPLCEATLIDAFKCHECDWDRDVAEKHNKKILKKYGFT